MMKPKILIGIFCVLSLSFSACKKDNSSTSITPPAFLKVGHEWHYQADLHSGDRQTFVYKVESQNTSGEYVISLSGLTTSPNTFIWYMDGTSLKQYGGTQDKSQATILWKSDAKLSDSWTSFASFQPSATEHDSITSVDQPIATVSGILNATAVYATFSDGTDPQTSYWSNNYGQVYINIPSVAQVSLTSKNF